MMETVIENLKTDIIAIGRLLWEKDLVTGLNGNISARVDNENILLTATQTCLGLLQKKDILLMKLTGEVLEEGVVSTERFLHTEVYKDFPQVNAVIHTHLTYTNAFFLNNNKLTPQIFESRFYLGEVEAITQTTPSVTDVAPVLEGLKKNNIVVLKNHGVVAVGKNLFDCFLLIQGLEDAVKIDAISRLYTQPSLTKSKVSAKEHSKKIQNKKYKLFSQDQIAEIVRVVNEDDQLKDMGQKTQMTMDLAVKLNETGQIYSFNFQNGTIVKVGQDENAEFLISAPKDIWKAVFNRQIDPFVATTQKKMHLRGDFAKISRWYAPCSRIFELWQKVPVE